MIAALVRELILPPASLFLMTALGLLVSRWHPRMGRTMSAVGLGALFFLSTGWGAWTLVYPLEQRTAALQPIPPGAAQAIVVLAAGRYVHAPEYGGAEIPDYIALARVRYAAHLYRKTGLPILVSGGNGRPDGSVKPKAQAMAAALREDFSIPVKWVEPDSETTAENALFTARLLKRDQVSRILLVTDAMHMPRSVMAFEASGLQVTPAPTIFFSMQTPGWEGVVPSAEHLRRSYYAVYEWLGLGWYWLRYHFASTPA